MSRWAYIWEKHRSVLNSLPLGFLVVYFINALVMTFPMYANTEWLENEVKMDQSTMNNYYAVIMIPVSLKPLYAFVTQHVPIAGMHRRPWVFLTAIITGLSYVVNGLWVRSVPLAFLVSFICSIGQAFNELMCSAVLMDAAHKDMKNAGALQAVANATRYAGSLVASMLQLLIYPCSDTSDNKWSANRVLIVTGIFAALAAFAAPLIPEPSNDEDEDDSGALTDPQCFDECDPAPDAGNLTAVLKQRDAVAYPLLGAEEEEEDPVENVHTRLIASRGPKEAGGTSANALQVTAVVAAFELVLVWITLKTFFPKATWWALLAVFTTIAFATTTAVGLLLGRSFQDRAGGASFWSMLREHRAAICSGLFLFAFNATPSASVQLYTFQFSYFKACDLTHLSLVGYAMTVLASFCYAPLANRQRVRWVLPILTAVSCGCQLFYIPLVNANLQYPVDGYHCFNALGTCINPLTYLYIFSSLNSFVSQLAFVPLEVVAVEQTPKDKRLLVYAIFLSIMSCGDSVREWVTAPIVEALGITYTDYSGLGTLVYISIASTMAVALLAPCILPNAPLVESVAEPDADDGNGDDNPTPDTQSHLN
ncbi:Folate-biopterin transporter [Diplonema papillatum]|nr:Folate-biopterin transporter [Diplonema papillatum]|eukprot:gene8700-13460_t